MKIIIALLASLVSATAGGNFLNVAILQLPDRYLADVPLANRGKLLTMMSENDDSSQLDYTHGWLHFYCDNPHENPGASGQFWVKLLPRKNIQPLVLVHMPKPFADGSATRKNQTFVLERRGNEWRDVTSSVIPEQVDLTMHFRPSRTKNVIEVAAYESFERRDGRGLAYRFGERKLDLVWNNRSFEIKEPDSPKLSELSE